MSSLLGSARLLPQKPSKWAKILLNRKVPIFLFFLLELAFLLEIENGKMIDDWD